MIDNHAAGATPAREGEMGPNRRHVEVDKVTGSSRRLRVRRCDPVELAGTWGVRHGGGVANAYGYRADTEVVASLAHGVVQVDVRARVPANKVTASGAIAATLGEWARPLVDERYGEERTEAARAYVARLARHACTAQDPAAAIEDWSRGPRLPAPPPVVWEIQHRAQLVDLRDRADEVLP